MEQNVLLSAECGRLELSMWRSTIKFADSVMDLFAPRRIGKGVVAGIYYWSLFYLDFGSCCGSHRIVTGTDSGRFWWRRSGSGRVDLVSR